MQIKPDCVSQLVGHISKISHSSCADQYGVMTSDTQTHTYTHTDKAHRAGVQLVVHTSINMTSMIDGNIIS